MGNIESNIDTKEIENKLANEVKDAFGWQTIPAPRPEGAGCIYLKWRFFLAKEIVTISDIGGIMSNATSLATTFSPSTILSMINSLVSLFSESIRNQTVSQYEYRYVLPEKGPPLLIYSWAKTIDIGYKTASKKEAVAVCCCFSAVLVSREIIIGSSSYSSNNSDDGTGNVRHANTITGESALQISPLRNTNQKLDEMIRPGFALLTSEMRIAGGNKTEGYKLTRNVSSHGDA